MAVTASAATIPLSVASAERRSASLGQQVTRSLCHIGAL